MFDKWVIAYDIDYNAATNADVTVPTIYNRIRARLDLCGFKSFKQLSIYGLVSAENGLVSVYRALQALSKMPERQYFKRLHMFRIDGALHDVLPIVDGRSSFGELAGPGEEAAA